MVNTRRRQTMRFLKVLLHNPAGVGAIAPSSEELAKVMVRDLELRASESVLEFGPGTGALTAQIRRIIPDPKSYLGIEREPMFVDLLQRRFPDMRFITGAAECAGELHQQAGLFPVKVIISALPVTSLLGEVQDAFIESLDRLMAPGCIFRTFQYLHAHPLPPAIRFRQRMNELFGQCHRSPPVLRNLPPAFVLTWTR